MDKSLLILGGILFLAVFLAVEGIYLWWNSTRGPEMRRISRRLQTMSAGGAIDSESARLFKQRLINNSKGFSRILLRMPRMATLDRYLLQSGMELSVTTISGITLGLFAVVFLLLLTLRYPVFFCFAMASVAALVPVLWVVFKRNRRLARFELLLPEALDLIGRSLRAGHAFPGAIQFVGSEMPDPVGPEFAQTFDEINFGVNVQTALQNLSRRMPITDLKFFVIAVSIQRETGGNLSEVLENISMIIRDRLKLFGRIKSLSAEGRMSAVILIALPFATLALLYTVNPKLTSILWTDETGIKLIYGMLFFMALGLLWIRQIVRIRV